MFFIKKSDGQTWKEDVFSVALIKEVFLKRKWMRLQTSYAVQPIKKNSFTSIARFANKNKNILHFKIGPAYFIAALTSSAIWLCNRVCFGEWPLN